MSETEAVGRRACRLLSFLVGVPLVLAACAGPSQVAGTTTASFSGVSPVSTAPRLRPPAPPPRFEELNGLDRARLVDLLGDPDFRRRESPGELWQYRTADCVLDVFLYREGSEIKVRHAETRDRGLLKVSQANCLGGLVAARSRLRESRL